MLQILNSQPYMFQILGTQSIISGHYRPFFYTHTINVDDGLLVSNVLTDELIWLSNEEKQNFKQTDNINNPIVKTLIEKWLLVPVDFDDLKLVNQVNEMRNVFSKGIKTDFLNSFVIFTTTDCNARCHYCFEHGCAKKTMTKQTAVDVAEFIIKKSKGRKVFIKWFGGEPLYNVDSINTICKILKENNIEFESRMVSNGYLFNEETILDDIKNWNFKSVQITLDGTEERYNKIKAFIYKDANSAFKRVTDNIELLLSNGISVNIRVHINLDNIDDTTELINYLIKRFSKFHNCKMYTQLLYDNLSDDIPSDDVRRLKYKIQNQLTDLIRKNGMGGTRASLAGDIQKGQCMADNDAATTILPDGKLGKCESYLDDEFWGSIYSDMVDYDVINSFKAMVGRSNDCDKCKWKPYCRHLLKCKNATNYCGEPEKELVTDNRNKFLIKEYHSYLKEHKQ